MSRCWQLMYPAGVTLAEKQTLVRNNGSEVQSLDPHKIEGVPESNISRDLFEGLLVSDLDRSSGTPHR
ncbi:hypothetical protein ACLB1N_07135 [Escherichia coli]